MRRSRRPGSKELGGGGVEPVGPAGRGRGWDVGSLSTGRGERLGSADRRAEDLGARARRTCSGACDRAAREAQDRLGFYGSGVDALARLRAAGVEPVGAEARVQISRRQRERQREENAWNASHPERADPAAFRLEVLPAIQAVPLRELARRTGLSVAYCARIRRGEEVPHQRWWGTLVASSSHPGQPV
jgi:hypothetical protein